MSETTSSNGYFLSSGSVKVFPLATSRTKDPTSNMFTEMNITNIVKYLFDFPSVVLSSEYEIPLKFILDGYYFETNLTNLLENWNSDDVYAQLVFNIEGVEEGDVDNDGNIDAKYMFRHLNGDTTLEVANEQKIEFGGLKLILDEDELTDSPYLHLLTRSGGKWTIPETFRYKFNSTAIKDVNLLNICVDGGDISKPTLLGDVNGDGEVTLADAELLAQYLSHSNVSINQSNSDMDGDGRINTKDQLELNSKLLNSQ